MELMLCNDNDANLRLLHDIELANAADYEWASRHGMQLDLWRIRPVVGLEGPPKEFCALFNTTRFWAMVCITQTKGKKTLFVAYLPSIDAARCIAFESGLRPEDER